MITELANAIHDSVCGDKCRRYVENNRHYEYYQEEAQRITDRISPVIGSGNVLEVVQVILEELV